MGPPLQEQPNTSLTHSLVLPLPEAVDKTRPVEVAIRISRPVGDSEDVVRIAAGRVELIHLHTGGIAEQAVSSVDIVCRRGAVDGGLTLHGICQLGFR